jgi:hypothetical protein
VFVCAVTAGAASALAQPVAIGGWATPALGRVLVAQEAEPGLAISAFGGWGFTEDVLGEGDAHHRVAGGGAIAGRPLRWLTIGGRIDGRWDAHVLEGNDDESLVGEPRLMVRGDVEVARGVSLGLASILFVPGFDAPSLDFEASTLDLRALASWRPDGLPLVLALDLGWRFDGTARAVERPVPFSRADMVSLGASDSDALLLGAGAVVRIEQVEIFGEITADVLVENDTAASPVRLAAGARAALLNDVLWLFGAIEVGLGGRAPIERTGTLYPVEPRVSLVLGLAGGSPLEVFPTCGVVDPPPTDDGTDARATRSVSGRVLDASGDPIAGARVRPVDAEEPRTTTAEDGSFTLEGVPAESELVFEAEGHVPQTLSLSPEGELVARLEIALPSGALRGLVRSRDGELLMATIHVEPGGASATTDAEGVFEVELQPGRYEVTIEADGYEAQRRGVEIEERGVTVINAELRRSR